MSKIQRITWTDEKLKQEVIKVMKTLNINRMPSNSEVMEVRNDTALSNAIRRHGGFYECAMKLGLEVKPSETKTGKGYEKDAMKLLKDHGYKVERMSVKYPFDLLVNDNISIDVKAGRMHDIKGTRWYTIGLNKRFATCDLYMIFALGENDIIDKFMIIPSNKLKLTTMNFGANSIYDKYINRWDYLKQYDDFYKKLA